MSDSNPSKGNHLPFYLGSLTEDDIARIALLFDVKPVELVATIRSIPGYAIAAVCTGDEVLSFDHFWKAIFADAYPDIYGILDSTPVTERMRTFHDEYRPLSIDTPKNERKKEYHFWEHLMMEMDAIMASSSHFKALQAILNDKEPSRDDYESLSHYPFITVFLAPQRPKCLNQLVDSDSPLFGAIEWEDESFDYALRYVSGPNVLSVLFKDKRLTNDMIGAMLRVVVHTGRFNVFKLLLSGGEIDRIAIDSDVIDIAARNGYTDMLELLLSDSRFNLTIDSNMMVNDAITSGRSNVLKLLLDDKRIQSTDSSETDLGLAVVFGSPEVVALLLDREVSPDVNYDMLIYEAAHSGKYEMVKLFLEDGRANPIANGHMVLEEAVGCGHKEIAELILADERITQEVRDKYALIL